MQFLATTMQTYFRGPDGIPSLELYSRYKNTLK